MITYVLTISEFFPKTHNKAGIPTGFINAISNKTKKHTIRGNFQLWQKRFEKIRQGKASLSVRYWVGKPYTSKQFEVFNFTNTDGIDIQKLEFYEDKDGVPALKYPLINNMFEPNINSVAENDGLSLADFKEWFKGYDLSEPMAIIHFTEFRYK
jgi:hypothetical protein